MARDQVGLRKAFQITNYATDQNLTVNAQLIVAIDVNNAGSGAGSQTYPNAILAPANSQYIIGVMAEPPDAKGIASVQLTETAQVQVGALNITAGQQVTSDGSGNAVPVTPSASGGAVKGSLGIAMNSALSGDLVDVLIIPRIFNG